MGAIIGAPAVGYPRATVRRGRASPGWVRRPALRGGLQRSARIAGALRFDPPPGTAATSDDGAFVPEPGHTEVPGRQSALPPRSRLLRRSGTRSGRGGSGTSHEIARGHADTTMGGGLRAADRDGALRPGWRAARLLRSVR